MEKKMIAKFKNEPKKDKTKHTKGYFQKANNGQQR